MQVFEVQAYTEQQINGDGNILGPMRAHRHNTSDDDKTTVAVSYRCRATEPCGSNVHTAHVSVFSTVVSEQLRLTACLRRHFVNYTVDRLDDLSMDLRAVSAALNKGGIAQSHEDDVHLGDDDGGGGGDGFDPPDYDAPEVSNPTSQYTQLAYTQRQRIFCRRWDNATHDNPYATVMFLGYLHWITFTIMFTL